MRHLNTINSFRHLPTEAAAVGHLESLAKAVRVGGIYALGLHLTPTKGEASDEESWSARAWPTVDQYSHVARRQEPSQANGKVRNSL